MKKHRDPKKLKSKEVKTDFDKIKNQKLADGRRVRSARVHGCRSDFEPLRTPPDRTGRGEDYDKLPGVLRSD